MLWESKKPFSTSEAFHELIAKQKRTDFQSYVVEALQNRIQCVLFSFSFKFSLLTYFEYRSLLGFLRLNPVHLFSAILYEYLTIVEVGSKNFWN